MEGNERQARLGVERGVRGSRMRPLPTAASLQVIRHRYQTSTPSPLAPPETRGACGPSCTRKCNAPSLSRGRVLVLCHRRQRRFCWVHVDHRPHRFCRRTMPLTDPPPSGWTVDDAVSFSYASSTITIATRIMAARRPGSSLPTLTLHLVGSGPGLAAATTTSTRRGRGQVRFRKQECGPVRLQ